MPPDLDGTRPHINVKLTISYDGSNFHGWQIQKNAQTVQGILTGVIQKVSGGAPVNLLGAGRTDTGVHAIGQVANFVTTRPYPAHKWLSALNGLLPPEIAVRKVQFVSPSFHARYSALKKTYLYLIGNEKSPFTHNREWFYARPLNLARMKKALAHLKGKKDFTSFAASATESKSMTCNLMSCSVSKDKNGFKFLFTADRFLTHMVRNLVGTVAEAGLGNLAPTEMKTILAARDRKKAGPTAPPEGLYLLKVYY